MLAINDKMTDNTRKKESKCSLRNQNARSLCSINLLHRAITFSYFTSKLDFTGIGVGECFR